MRRTLLPLAVLLAGCTDEFTIKNKPVELPDVPAAAVETAARVDRVGQKLAGSVPFLGIDPVFQTVGRPQPEIVHHTGDLVLVTDGLVAKCKSDDELAAVLATELGKMAAAKRAGERFRRDPPPAVPDNPNMGAHGIGPDQIRLAELAKFEEQEKKRKPADAAGITADLMQTAGYDPKALAAVAPLLKDAAKNHTLADQFRDPAAAPKWSN